MKRQLLTLLAAGAFALAGCSSVKTRVDTGTVHASTFSFINTGAKPPPATVDNSAAIHAMVQAAITRTLAGKGVSKLTAALLGAPGAAISHAETGQDRELKIAGRLRLV